MEESHCSWIWQACSSQSSLTSPSTCLLFDQYFTSAKNTLLERSGYCLAGSSESSSCLADGYGSGPRSLANSIFRGRERKLLFLSPPSFRGMFFISKSWIVVCSMEKDGSGFFWENRAISRARGGGHYLQQLASKRPVSFLSASSWVNWLRLW